MSTPPYGYQSAPQYQPGGPTPERDNSFGVIALVCGILSLVVCGPLGIVAIIYGRKAAAAEAAGTATNGAMGTVGFWLGVVGLALTVIVIVVMVVMLALGVALLPAAMTTSY
ncbi:DUF4190 domain-containing protein [Ornithinicoccus halotolerans]|uniref:DUF4190 domain-containing protein n=1 Tax=Ornithinicoccus halotolerans TaxID=1748220 RepID=UPI00129671EB|nr:DUF4190 domain-containing protein [Ornithinicoccus halotolerans]